MCVCVFTIYLAIYSITLSLFLYYTIYVFNNHKSALHILLARLLLSYIPQYFK